jgi:hypothetical protein
LLDCLNDNRYQKAADADVYEWSGRLFHHVHHLENVSMESFDWSTEF